MPRFAAATVVDPRCAGAGAAPPRLVVLQPRPAAARAQPRRAFVWWSRERVLAALRAYHAAHGDAPTSGPVWDRLEHVKAPRTGNGRRRYPRAASIVRWWPTMRQAWIAAGVDVGRQRDRWLPADVAFLRRWWGAKPDRWVADRLGRTRDACIIRAHRDLHAARKANLRAQGVMTAREVAALFGVDPTTPVRRWALRGWLVPVQSEIRCGTNGRTWLFCGDCVRHFIATMGWAYDWRRMDPAHELTALAREVHERDPWLTIAEFRRTYGVSGSFTDLWRARGLLPFRWRPKQGRAGHQEGVLVIRRADVAPALARIAAAKHERASAQARERARRDGLPNGRFPKDCAYQERTAS